MRLRYIKFSVCKKMIWVGISAQEDETLAVPDLLSLEGDVGLSVVLLSSVFLEAALVGLEVLA